MKKVDDDPYEHFLQFVRRVAREADRKPRLDTYIQRAEMVVRAANTLHSAWSTEESILTQEPKPKPRIMPQLIFSGVPAPTPTSMDRVRAGERNPNLTRFLKSKPSVRAATLATIYYLAEPLAPGEITNVLGEHGFQFGKGKAGDLVRSALWHARKSGQIAADENGKQGFASQEAERQFVREEVETAESATS
jgi:hypothetical protein